MKNDILASLRKFKCKIRNSARMYGSLFRLIYTKKSNKKRILGIWDYKALPWSVGDPLVFIEKLSVLKNEMNAEEIDLCVVYDREAPGGNRGPGNLSPENAQDYMLESLPLFSTCPYLGSIFQFNSRKEFLLFLKANIERYFVYPPLPQQLTESYNYVGGAPDINDIQAFYRKHGYLPHLRVGEREMAWARSFYLNVLNKNQKSVFVALSLRQPFLDDNYVRNANPGVWLPFIDRCNVEYPDVVFVVVGLREESFEELRSRPNVIIAKDHGTTITEDFALIRTSIMYMATCSGINTIANYSDLPYLIFQYDKNVLTRYGLKAEELFPFVKDLQRIYVETTPLTADLLFNEFQGLFSLLDKDRWIKTTREKAANKRGHPCI